jgi:hypothetical protein
MQSKQVDMSKIGFAIAEEKELSQALADRRIVQVKERL